MKKYLYGAPEADNRSKHNVIELTHGFSVDVRYDSYEIVVTIANSTNTMHICHELDISRAMDTADVDKIKSYMLDYVREELQEIVSDADSATFTDIYELWEEWEDVLADEFYTEECRTIHYQNR